MYEAAKASGEAVYAAIKARRASKREQAAGTKTSLELAARAVMRRQALREADMLRSRNILSQLQKLHAKCAEGMREEVSLWRDWPADIGAHADGIVATLERQAALIAATEQGATPGGDDRPPSAAVRRRPASSPAGRRRPRADSSSEGPSGGVDGGQDGGEDGGQDGGQDGAAWRAAEWTADARSASPRMRALLDRIQQAIDAVDGAYVAGAQTLDDVAWKRGQEMGALEEAERRGRAFDKWCASACPSAS